MPNSFNLNVSLVKLRNISNLHFFYFPISVVYLGRKFRTNCILSFRVKNGERKRCQRQRKYIMKILQWYPFIFSWYHLFKAKLMIIVFAYVSVVSGPRRIFVIAGIWLEYDWRRPPLFSHLKLSAAKNEIIPTMSLATSKPCKRWKICCNVRCHMIEIPSSIHWWWFVFLFDAAW